MSTTRRGFLMTAGAAGVGAWAPGLANALRGHSSTRAQEPDLLLGEGEGDVYLIGERQGRVVIKVDD